MFIYKNIRDKSTWWIVYISCEFNVTYKYNFYGTQIDLFTLIGAVYSTWFVGIKRIDYVKTKCYDKEIKGLYLYPFKKSYKTYERSIQENE